MRNVLAFVGLALALGLSTAADEPKTGSDGFVQLFNGKDLSGWITHPADKAKWEVKDGVIVGTGPAGHLYSERKDFVDFVYRVEAMISDKGNSGQYFRATFGKGFPPGYEVQINSTGSDSIRTGSLYPDGKDKYSPEEREKMLVKEQLHKPNEWFTQEVTVNGNHFVIKVNGKQTIDFVDAKNRHKKGHFAIQQHDPGTIIKIRKVEVKELPAAK